MARDLYTNVKAIVTDIEGTITPPAFIKEVLSRYVSEKIPDYIWDYESDISRHLDTVREQEKNFDLTTEEIIEVLLRYLDERKKNNPLQALYTLIVAEGYQAKKIQSLVYEDALHAFRRWREHGILVYIYSTLSVQEQRLFLTNTQAGDITDSFNGLFDTQSGEKRQTQSYDKIAVSLGLPSPDILFLTDNIEDAVTASNSGMKVIVLDRQACLVNAYGCRIEHDFDNILPETVSA